MNKLQDDRDQSPPRVAGYVRVSTGRQVDEGYSLDAQTERIHSHAGNRLIKVYADAGISGRRDDRPELAAALADAEAGKFDVLVIPKLDRLGRSVRQLQENFDRLDRAGVQLVSLTESIDTSTATGRLLRNILSALAEFEGDNIGDRVRSVNQERVRAGRHNGGPRPYGYLYPRNDDGNVIKDAVIEPVDDEAVVMRRIYEQYVAGTPQLEIARRLSADGIPTAKGGEWHQGTIANYLRNPLYKGYVTLNGEEFPGEHEAIVSAELWEQAKQVREAAAKSRGGGRGRCPKGRHLFVRGALKCGSCGESMAPITKPNKTGGTYEVYDCYGRTSKKNGCPSRPIQRERIDSGVIDYFLAVAVDVDATRAQLEEVIERGLADVRVHLRRAEQDERQASERLARVRRDYQDGKVEADDWREQREVLVEEQRGARHKLEMMREREATIAASTVVHDAEAATLQHVADLRSIIVGDFRDAKTVEATRAKLAKLFEGFTLHRLDEGGLAPVPRYWEPDLVLVGGYYVEPHIRPQAIASAAPEGYEGEVMFPVLHREPLDIAGNKYADGLVM